jgi:hypothetical protein
MAWGKRDADYYRNIVKRAVSKHKGLLEKSIDPISDKLTDYYADVRGLEGLPGVGGMASGIENWWKGGPDVDYEDVHESPWIGDSSEDAILAFEDFEEEQEQGIIDAYQGDIANVALTTVGLAMGVPASALGTSGAVIAGVGKAISSTKLWASLLAMIAAWKTKGTLNEFGGTDLMDFNTSNLG